MIVGTSVWVNNGSFHSRLCIVSSRATRDDEVANADRRINLLSLKNLEDIIGWAIRGS